MRVSVSVPGTFHAFRLAEQLDARSAIPTVFTTHPEFALDTTLPSDRISPIRHPEALNRVCRRIPILGDVLPNGRWKSSLFDRSVARNLSATDPDLFLGFAGVSSRSISKAREIGAVPIVERCSTHIRTQASILKAEFDRFGVDRTPIFEEQIRKEEAEYEAAARVVTPSEFVYQSFVDQGFDEEKLICEPFGVDVEKYEPPSDDEGRHTDETVRFLFAGRVGLRKGIPYLLQAWDELGLENATLHVAGPVEAEAGNVVQPYESDDSIEFLGWVDDINELYRECDVFVFPTLEEGSAYVTYEAMACEMPVITTSHSGWVGEDGTHGREVPVRSSAELADAIEALYEDAERRTEMGRSAREHVETDYTWDDYGDRIYARYRGILDGVDQVRKR